LIYVKDMYSVVIFNLLHLTGSSSEAFGQSGRPSHKCLRGKQMLLFWQRNVPSGQDGAVDKENRKGSAQVK